MALTFRRCCPVVALAQAPAPVSAFDAFCVSVPGAPPAAGRAALRFPFSNPRSDILLQRFRSACQRKPWSLLIAFPRIRRDQSCISSTVGGVGFAERRQRPRGAPEGTAQGERLFQLARAVSCPFRRVCGCRAPRAWPLRCREGCTYTK